MLAASSAFSLIGTLVIILLCMVHFYLKSSSLTSFASVISAVFGVIIAFNFYEPLADQLISRGYGGQWAQAGCFFLLFVIGLAAIRSLADFLIGSNINFGPTVKHIAAGICALVTGVIISGAFIITLALSPIGPKFCYNRFDKMITIASANNPKKLILNVDGVVTGLFSCMSKGSLSSSKSFGVYHADFLNQIHLNSNKAREKVIIASSKDAIELPGRNKKPVRKKEIESQKLTIVRVGLINREIADGGAKGPDGIISFTPGQIRLLCKDKGDVDNMKGNAKALYPVQITKVRDKAAGFQDEILPTKKDLGMIITLERDDFQKRTGWLDVAFEVPDSMEGILLQFKQNAVIKLPKPVTSTDEIEQQLNDSGSPGGGESST
jgi:hypothetical protein